MSRRRKTISPVKVSAATSTSSKPIGSAANSLRDLGDVRVRRDIEQPLVGLEQRSDERDEG
jgi:hypothetical protein